MTPQLTEILARLQKLVAVDTRNPPRDMDASHPIVGTLADGFPDECRSVNDLGEGCVQILIQRGKPKTLINVHVDTVPCADGWTHSPHELHRAEDRAYGLGACDIKGAAAAAIVAAQAQDNDFALLFTTDEENGQGKCVRDFAAKDHGFADVIVCEPTGCEAILAHRGIGAYDVEFAGKSMHSSERAALDTSAVHRAGNWIASATEHADNAYLQGGELPGYCFNVGRIEGGIKPNICAPNAVLNFGLRPGPGYSVEVVASELCALAPKGHISKFQKRYADPALHLQGTQKDRAIELADRLGIPVGKPVNFWTEAALFAETGVPCFVFGPGHIAQAHSVDEWVAYDQLLRAHAAFVKVFGNV